MGSFAKMAAAQHKAGLVSLQPALHLNISGIFGNKFQNIKHKVEGMILYSKTNAFSGGFPLKYFRLLRFKTKSIFVSVEDYTVV